MSDKPTYTTAIIAAVPDPSDPVNEHVIEDAHVTLHFLGEADTLSPEQVEEIQASLELMAANLYPFPADVAGTAELGPNKAKVLLVQSEPLTKIKEILGAVPAVSTAVAAAEQFPNWIPHLTLAYAEDGAQVGNPGVESVTIGSLELWMADERVAVCPLAKAAPGPVEEESAVAASVAVIAAGLKKFEEHLHPRDASGRFIEKFGVVKFLTGQGWAYGKVEGIYEEDGQVKVTVTPSDLSGKPTGAESKVLVPKQVYRAPKKVAHLTTAAKTAKKIGGQGGSNPGGLYTIPTSGTATEPEKFYVKKPKSKSHGANEALANDLYAEAGVPVPEVDMASDGQLYSKIVEGQQDMAQQLDNPEWADQVRRNFAVDAWLGNRDVFGLTYDNILTDEHGVPWRIDNGGALLYRAMGEKKTDFGSKVTELDVFRTGKKAKIFGTGMTKAQELDGAERVVAILPHRIDEMVAEQGLPKSLADTLKARRLYIADYYGLTLPESQKPAEAQEGTSAPLVDPADLAKAKGKPRDYFPLKLHQAALLGQAGDRVEFPDGSRKTVGQDEDGGPLSSFGMVQQQLDWASKYGPEAEVYVRKTHHAASLSRPSHGQKLTGDDLSAQRWQRGDKIVGPDGVPLKILGYSAVNGAMLTQHGDKPPQLLDTFGADANAVFTVERWDPPAEETLAPVEEDTGYAPQTFEISFPDPMVQANVQLAEAVAEDKWLSKSAEVVTPAAESQQDVTPEPAAPVPGKTGQAAEAEAAIKADLEQPLPTGNGAPAPAKTTAPSGAKEMQLGDGTTAQTGAEVVSKKDGKTYKFVKPKGQYAVVTDPNGEDPSKQLLKLASTMTQPGKQPSADNAELEKPKTASGEVPALGMMAVAKDGWAGEITLISPDGKFVFITDATGKRKRKSTGAVTVTAAPQTVAEAVDTAPPVPVAGPVKPYGAKPTAPPPDNTPSSTGYKAASEITTGTLVHVGYADGSHGVEPYTGQPVSALAQNTQGKIATFGALSGYLGPVSASQLADAAAASGHSTNYGVIWNGTLGWTNGKTGPNGGLWLWDYDEPASAKIELPASGALLTVVDGVGSGVLLPEFPGVIDQATDTGSGPAPLWSDEAKPLSQWAGQLVEGQEISLDGQHWLTIKKAYQSGSVDVVDSNGSGAYLTSWSLSTYVAKAPAVKDAEKAASPQPTTGIPALDELNALVDKGKVKVTDLTYGDVVVLPNGETEIIGMVKQEPGDLSVYVTPLGEVTGEFVDQDEQVTKVGNAAQGPVDMTISSVVDKLYPGVKLQMAPGEGDQVLSYPKQLDNGNWQFAVMLDNDPDNVTLVEVGTGGTAQIGPGAVMGVHFAPLAFPTEVGVDVDKLDQLFNDANTVATTTPIDHKWQMAEQGIDFGKAQYPVFFNSTDSSYYREGPGGVEGWENGAWVADPDHSSVVGMEKVWEGKPSYNLLDLLPDGAAPLWKQSHATIKANPGEAITAFEYNGLTYFAVHPNGDPNGPAHMITSSGNIAPKAMPEDWNTGSAADDYHNFTVVVDPFGLAQTPEPNPKPTITHHEGPDAPQALQERLATLGYAPAAGETFLAVQRPSGAMAVLVKQPDGTYQVISWNGALKTKKWTLAEAMDPEATGEGATFFTWTNIPADAAAPATVQGLPEGFAPFVPSEGQAVLKTTLASGIEKVYLQQQPNGGWYLMAPDGTVDESSDAIKSNHVVQLKLAGKGTQAVKYDLLHPAAEGVKAAPEKPPTLTNAGGDWTPKPGQKVVALSSGDNDADPWYFVQDEPGGMWVKSPNTTIGTPKTDAEMQALLNSAGSGNGYKLVYGGQGGDLSAVDTAPDNGGGSATPSFNGYIPAPDEEVVSYTSPAHADTFYYLKKPGEKHWHGISEDGEVSSHIAVYADSMPENKGPDFGNDYAQEWPLPEGQEPDEPVSSAPSFDGYAPQPGEKIASLGTVPPIHYVQTSSGGKWFKIQDGAPVGNGISDAMMQEEISTQSDAHLVWPPGAGDAGTFAGYQTKSGESVVELVGATTSMTLVKNDTTGEWHPIENGLPSLANTYSQDTVEWLASNSEAQGTTFTVLQGELKAAPEPTVGVVETEGSGQYAGVKNTTPVWPAPSFGAYSPSQEQLDKLKGLDPLDPGQSLYLLSDAADPSFQSGGVLIRNSDGTWLSVWADGTVGPFGKSDAEVETYVQGSNYVLNKAQWGAPAAPAPGTTKNLGTSDLDVQGWSSEGLPAPSSFGWVADTEGLVGTKAGAWVLVQSGAGALFVKLHQDYTSAGSDLQINEWHTVKDGKVGKKQTPTDGKDSISMSSAVADTLYVQGKVGPPLATAPSVPNTPTASEATAPEAPVGPQYPGATKPSQEDINAWGGELTKDGHIPSSGMFVTGKGPMAGKIISVSKDKTKATVMTSDGKKTTRLISALKTDKTANYQAYAAPVTAKDIPGGMPLAVDTVAEVLAKTPKDGKFRAILTAHPGVSHGAITVTRATGPSGKVYNRVHLTLTPAQREQLTAMLAAGGPGGVPKGDWATSSKMSQNVAAGDLLPMRKSSTNNPDGTPRWKVDPSITPPTHEVTGVTDDPAGGGIKLVTLKDRNTGEEITSRFHPGKSLTTYAWDPNKPKPVVASSGAVKLGEIAQADGWTFTTDGGISAATGGAQSAQMKVEPGQAVSTSSSALGQIKGSWPTLRNVSADGVVIETVDPKGSSSNSSTGTTVITVPEGVDETALGAAFAKLGIDYSPMTQDSAKVHVRGLLRTLLSLDLGDVDTPKHYTDEMLFAQAGTSMGISDLGWQDVLVGVDESTGKTSYFWSDRARAALAAKVKYNLVYRAASNGGAAQIVSTVKYGSASSMMKKTAGMLDGSASTGGGASAQTDNGNHAGHGSYGSASTVGKLPGKNSFADYKGEVGMMVYHRPEAVLGRIMDIRLASHDAFGKGQGPGSDHLKHAVTMPSVRDYFLGGGLPTEAVGFIAVLDAGERAKAIAQLKQEGFTHINGRPIEEILITKQAAAKLSPDDLPPVTLPINARPILALPTSYDAPAVTASGEDETGTVDTAQPEHEEVA